MDPRRFDALTKSLAATPSRRRLLKTVAAATLGGLIAVARGGVAAEARRQSCDDAHRCANGRVCVNGVCQRCLSEGAESANPDFCCSGKVQGGVCCSDTAHCAKSGCCGDGVCVDGRCAACVPEGHASANAADCCSRTTGGGVCCGTTTCAQSRCCDPASAIPFCVDGRCTACLPEGEQSGDPAFCCSGEVGDGVCCGTKTCHASGCCGSGRACDEQGRCLACLKEGEQVGDNPRLCCSQQSVDGVCCGVGGGGCHTSGCCSEGICVQGRCEPCIPQGERDHDDARRCCSGASRHGFCCGVGNDNCGDSGCCAAGWVCSDVGICTAVTTTTTTTAAPTTTTTTTTAAPVPCTECVFGAQGCQRDGCVRYNTEPCSATNPCNFCDQGVCKTQCGPALVCDNAPGSFCRAAATDAGMSFLCCPNQQEINCFGCCLNQNACVGPGLCP